MVRFELANNGLTHWERLSETGTLRHRSELAKRVRPDVGDSRAWSSVRKRSTPR